MYRFLSIQAFLSLLLISPAVLSNGLSFSTATDFTTGNYGGASPTDIWYVPFTARYDKDRASFRLIIPYLNITGPGNVLGPGIGGIDGRGTIIGGGFSGASPGSGGGIVVCDDDTENCSGKNPGRGGDNSGSGGGSGDDDDDDSGSGGGSGDDDDDDSGSGGGGGDDDDDDPGSGGGGGGGDDDDDDSGGGGDDDDDNSGSGGGGGDDDDSGSGGGGGGDDDDEDVDSAVSRIKLSKVHATGLVGGIPLGGPDLPSSTRSGLGDIIAAFSYNLINHAPSGIIFDITARLKIPTASESQNMGTGKVDYAIQGDMFKTISKFTLSATLGYRFLGNPNGITFHNVIYGAAGIGYQLSPTVTVGTSYHMGQSPVRLEDSRDLTLYLSQRVTDHFRLNIYGLRGFSDRSPDWGGGINLRYVF